MPQTNKQSTAFAAGWQLVWRVVSGHPDSGSGAMTHAMNDADVLACGRHLGTMDQGSYSTDAEAPWPTCKQCQKRLEREGLTHNASVAA